MSTPTRAARVPRARHAGPGEVVLRRLPGTSAMHRLWVGTKLITLVLLTVATLLDPSWPQLATTATVVALAIAAARAPASAVPRIPLWFWLPALVGLVFAAIGHGAGHYLQLFCVNLLFLVLSMVLCWTTALDEIAPALRTLGAPLRRLGVPIEEWALATALCVRSLPMLIDECRTVLAARRLRRQRPRPGAATLALVDLLTAAMVAAIRRGGDVGEALAIRGGARAPRGRGSRPGWRDLAALSVVTAACVVPSALGV